jgi:hypothetical protein
MPEQVGEILEDLRKGHLTVRTTDVTAARNADRLGRRIFSGLAVGSLVVSGTVLLAAGRHDWLGFAMLGAAFSTAGIHLVRDWWNGMQQRAS